MYFDAHSDIWTDVAVRRLRGESDVFHQHHLVRLQKGGVEGSIFVIWIDPPFDADYLERTKQIMHAINQETTECTDFRMVHTYDEMMQAKRDGIFYVFIGIEGMAAIGSDLSMIDDYYQFGCRHAMLTWNEANALGAGALSGEDYGLTAYGKRAVTMMQDKGMLIDVSHLNEAGFWDVAKQTIKPFIASHSNAKALCDTPRNLSDDQLRAIRDAGGVVGLNAYHEFLDADCSQRTVQRLAQHAAYMIDLIGIDHVGCGFDFCEFIEEDSQKQALPAWTNSNTVGLEDCSKIPSLFACFEKMGMSHVDQEKVAFRNFHRVIKHSIG